MNALKDQLNHNFQNTPLPSNFEQARVVVVTFHGHTNSGKTSARWPIKKSFPTRTTCFLNLNAPHAYYDNKDSFEWFTYIRDEGVDAYEIDNSEFKTIEALMKVMNLEARKKDIQQTIQWVVSLFVALADVGKDVYFVGTSQGAATAFLSALHILSDKRLHRRRFCGGYFHHMAGTYPALFPSPFPPELTDRVVFKQSTQDQNGRRVKRMKKGDDTHGNWASEEELWLTEAVHRALTGTCESPQLIIPLTVHDHVVPIALQSLLETRLVRLTKRKSGTAA